MPLEREREREREKQSIDRDEVVHSPASRTPSRGVRTKSRFLISEAMTSKPTVFEQDVALIQLGKQIVTRRFDQVGFVH